MDSNIDEIVEQIFSKPPGPPNSIQLQLEEQTAEIASQDGVENFIFSILCMITVKGIEKLYGHKEIHALTEKQIHVIKRYVESYGYKLKIYANDTEFDPWELMKRNVQVYRFKIEFIHNLV